MRERETRDIIVIGASTGGVEALKTVVGGLPADLSAAVFVVLHQPEVFRSHLTDILRRVAKLPVEEALHDQTVELGHIYVAPPDNHLLLRAGHVSVVRSARENGHRPAVNPLFRSAATVYGPRVIGVVLTGALDCGAAGLTVIKAHGGTGVAEDPQTAVCGDMPGSAIRTGAVDHVAHLADIAPTLVRLTSQKGSGVPLIPPPEALESYSFVTCPNCNGSMTESGEGESVYFACHTGHAFRLRNLYAEQSDQVEFAMWAAIRALEESAAVAGRLAGTAHGELRSRFEEKQRAMRLHAGTLRDMVMGGQQGARVDVAPDSRS